MGSGMMCMTQYEAENAYRTGNVYICTCRKGPVYSICVWQFPTKNTLSVPKATEARDLVSSPGVSALSGGNTNMTRLG